MGHDPWNHLHRYILARNREIDHIQEVMFTFRRKYVPGKSSRFLKTNPGGLALKYNQDS